MQIRLKSMLSTLAETLERTTKTLCSDRDRKREWTRNETIQINNIFLTAGFLRIIADSLEDEEPKGKPHERRTQHDL